MRLFLVALCLSASLAIATPYDYGWVAHLAGLNEVPPNASPASGLFTASLNAAGNSFSYSATWGGLLGTYTASHIHGPAAVGQNAGVLHALVGAGPTGTPGGAWAIPGSGVARLYNDSLYVNVHSQVFPGGEVRDQLRCEPDTADFDWTDMGGSQCIQLCEDYSSFIRIWHVPSGLLPVVIKRFGCVACSVDCYPANIITEFLGGVWQPGLGYVWLEIRGNGCICVEFDGFLAVEVGSFDAVAGDGEVTLNWSTRSETNNDRFEVERDGQLIASINGLGNTATGHDYSWTDRAVMNGHSYGYKLFAVDLDGSRTEVGTETVTPAAGAVIDTYTLLQNFPNPFNPETNIAFELAEAGVVNLTVFDMTGRLVATLVNNASMPRGSHSVSFEAVNLPSGIYIYRMEVNGFADQRKMLLLK